MERKIGEIFEHNGEWYQCVKSDGTCNGCVGKFQPYSFCNGFGECVGKIFKKLEKVGGILGINKKTYQCIKPIYHKGCTGCVFEKSCRHICRGLGIYVEIKQNQEDMEENKIRLRQEEIDFLRRKFREIIQDYVIQGCDKEKIQYEFGTLFEPTQGPYNEEKKINLKPFDIEAARSGKPVCTRDGRKARIICTDLKANNYPIVATVLGADGIEFPHTYTLDGIYSKGEESGFDLMMLPEKKEGWVNIVRGSDGSPHMGRGIFQSKEEAENTIKAFSDNLIDTVKINWEE